VLPRHVHHVRKRADIPVHRVHALDHDQLLPSAPRELPVEVDRRSADKNPTLAL
jgi:hypothetical protein